MSKTLFLYGIWKDFVLDVFIYFKSLHGKGTEDKIVPTGKFILGFDPPIFAL